MAPRSALSATLPFHLHALLELPASIKFWTNPLSLSPSVIPSYPPGALAIYRQYATLLFSSVLIALVFALRRGTDRTARLVAGALGIYHVAPCVRAWARLSAGDAIGGAVRGKGEGGGGLGADLGGPGLHLVLHAVCFLALFKLCLLGAKRGCVRKS